MGPLVGKTFWATFAIFLQLYLLIEFFNIKQTLKANSRLRSLLKVYGQNVEKTRFCNLKYEPKEVRLEDIHKRLKLIWQLKQPFEFRQHYTEIWPAKLNNNSKCINWET